MFSRTTQRSNQGGFTLVELAIVLVIIGLIVGGVLVGQDLIKSAEVRATITQIEKFNAAATTFRDKFGGLPGDLTAARATQFGINPAARAATAGQGNGDGLVEGDTAPSALAGETLAFWSDLTQASLIPEANTAPATMTVADAGTVADLPTARLRDTAVFHIYTDVGRNFFYMGTPTIAAGVVTIGDGLSPLQAFSIDEKLDNGNAIEGVVVAVSDIEPNTDEADGTCHTGGVYETGEAEANVIACSLSVRASF